jgi:hypothetical protein
MSFCGVVDDLSEQANSLESFLLSAHDIVASIEIVSKSEALHDSLSQFIEIVRAAFEDEHYADRLVALRKATRS